LELIESEDDEKIRAVSAFFRASADRTAWSKAGLIHETSLEDFEEALVTFWRNRKRSLDLVRKDSSAVDQGRLLYGDCIVHRRTLEGLEVPDYFTPGSFHTLADDEKVGWHPYYKAKLAEPATPKGEQVSGRSK
jgi:hypothetical protein